MLKGECSSNFWATLTHLYKIANGEYSTEQHKGLKVSAQPTFRPHSPICTKLQMLKGECSTNFWAKLTHLYKIANGEYSTEQQKGLKVSAQPTFRPYSPICTKLQMVSTQQNN